MDRVFVCPKNVNPKGARGVPTHMPNSKAFYVKRHVLTRSHLSIYTYGLFTCFSLSRQSLTKTPRKNLLRKVNQRFRTVFSSSFQFQEKKEERTQEAIWVDTKTTTENSPFFRDWDFFVYELGSGDIQKKLERRRPPLPNGIGVRRGGGGKKVITLPPLVLKRLGAPIEQV